MVLRECTKFVPVLPASSQYLVPSTQYSLREYPVRGTILCTSTRTLTDSVICDVHVTVTVTVIYYRYTLHVTLHCTFLLRVTVEYCTVRYSVQSLYRTLRSAALHVLYIVHTVTTVRVLECEYIPVPRIREVL